MEWSATISADLVDVRFGSSAAKTLTLPINGLRERLCVS